MSVRTRSPFRYLLILLLIAALLVLTVAVVSAKSGQDKKARLTVSDVDFEGIVTFVTGSQFAGTEVGGLSGITYDSARGVYYVISDDRSQTNDSRYYTVDIDFSDGTLEDGDVTFLDVTTILNENRLPFETNEADPEGIALRKAGQLFISSEYSTPDAGFVKRFNWAGAQTKTLPIPEKFAPGPGTGARSNLAFESLSFTPNNSYLWTAVENALVQDGGTSTLTDSSPARMIQFHTPRAEAMQEVVYVVEPIPVAPNPAGSFADNGLVDLAGLDDHGTLLAMERSFAVGVGNTVKIFEILTDDATDVSGYSDGLPSGYVPVDKRLILDVGNLVRPDNLEGMTLGPKLPNGRQSLLLVSDNNFNPFQITQFILLSLDIDKVSP